jgi:hypothetical protein
MTVTRVLRPVRKILAGTAVAVVAATCFAAPNTFSATANHGSADVSQATKEWGHRSGNVVTATKEWGHRSSNVVMATKEWKIAPSPVKTKEW